MPISSAEPAENLKIFEVSPTLAGRSVAKMNGIGNEIVVLDLRGADPQDIRKRLNAGEAVIGMALDIFDGGRGWFSS